MLNAFFNSSIVSAIKLGNNSISKIFLGNNLVFRDPPNCPEGQILDPVTGDCYYNFSAVTPTGLNVTLNPFSQQETGTSLGLSVTFQEVTAQGTTTIREFPSASNPTTDFKGIQIDTTCSFVGDINLTFLLPNNISLSDFNSLSVFSLIDNSNLTLSRDYTSKTIQAKISYVQELSIMTEETTKTNKLVVTPGGDEDCIGNDAGLPAEQRKNKFHVYWKYWGGIFGGWVKCCRVNTCTGSGNDFITNDECNCKCPAGNNVCYDHSTGAQFAPWTCYSCNYPKIFLTNPCRCECPNTCSSSTHRPPDINCTCECKEGYTKCGQTINSGTIGGQAYSYINEKCCQPGWTCSGIRDGETEGECCSPDKTPCNGRCCEPGQNCVNNQTCCPPGVTSACGGVCCVPGEVCAGNTCCPENKACGNVCCETGEVCVNGLCYPECTPSSPCWYCAHQWGGVKYCEQSTYNIAGITYYATQEACLNDAAGGCL